MRVHYAWIVAGVTFLALLASAGIRATSTVLILPLEQEFGWDRATISSALSVNLLLFGLCGPFAGALMRAPTPVGSGAANPFALAVNTLAESARVKDFWLLAGSFAICGATTVGLISVHLIPASVDHGMAEVTAAGMLAAMGVFDLIGTTASGWLSDRMDPRKLLVWYYTLRGIALLFLPYAYTIGVPALAAFVVFYGLDWVATVPPTVKLVADKFGKERVGPVLGWVFAAHQFGGSLAAFGGGAIHTWQGDYLSAFLAAGALCLLASGLILGLSGRAATPPLVLRPLATKS